MIHIRTIDTFGFEGALYGCRMPFESHEKSDSCNCTDQDCKNCSLLEWGKCTDEFVRDYCLLSIGNKDMELCKKLIRGGSEHRKFLRMIHVQAEVNAPRYWWTEFDCYKFVEKNSSSTMHLITKRHLTVDDFSYDTPEDGFKFTVRHLNNLIKEYNETESDTEKKALFRKIKQLLPESFMQRRVIDTNYEELLNIYRQRKNHKLSEWHEFCDWLKSLPYMDEFISAMEGK